METAEIIAISVVVLIAAAEIFCLFICSKHKKKSYPLCIVIPVLSDDIELEQRLGYISCLIEDSSTFIKTVLLVDIDGSNEQVQLCRDFCQAYHAAEFTNIDEIGTALKNYLHFH